MNRNHLRRTSAGAAAVLVLALGLAACSEDDGGGDDTASEDTPTATEDSPPPTEEEPPADDAGAQTFGPGCKLIPASGAGSFNGMATEPVATAASANPLLTTLVTAVKKAGLVDTLNSAEALTVFAPTNDAFAKIPKKDLDAVLADKETLTKILTHHVIGEQLAPEALAGTHETLNADMVTVKGSGEQFTVADENSAVLCGNIPTANATVYVVDTVLMP
ncbi:fasciclin domain-containing protein [Nocardioides speluncae]|uniref:fasciclin domain-containing protein n=1 Tax=Nocardioides speluncae TaxID=2670337 RepID=UPI000D68BA1E|nr:fasciclin domain-containing protein [Nocardioides speluncae]